MFNVYHDDELVGSFDMIETSFKAVSANLKMRNVDCRYFREWYDKEEQKIVIDYGSWSNFYYIKNVTEEEFTRWIKGAKANG